MSAAANGLRRLTLVLPTNMQLINMKRLGKDRLFVHFQVISGRGPSESAVRECVPGGVNITLGVAVFELG